MNIFLIGICCIGDYEVLLCEGVKVVLSDYEDLNVFYKVVDSVLEG